MQLIIDLLPYVVGVLVLVGAIVYGEQIIDTLTPVRVIISELVKNLILACCKLVMIVLLLALICFVFCEIEEAVKKQNIAATSLCL